MRRELLLSVALVTLGACEDARFGAREAGALGGVVLGAGLGAILGDQVGNTGEGIAIGAAVGGLAGGLTGDQYDKQQQQLDSRKDTLAQQQKQIEQNRKLIEELRARGADVRSTKRGVVVNLPDVLFEFGRSRLTNDARGTVSQIADVLRQFPERKISVEGHTDSVGSIQYNQQLSEDRARSVGEQLSSEGVLRRRIKIEGFGELDPIASNQNDSGRQRNRRVEVIIEND